MPKLNKYAVMESLRRLNYDVIVRQAMEDGKTAEEAHEAAMKVVADLKGPSNL